MMLEQAEEEFVDDEEIIEISDDDSGMGMSSSRGS